MRIRWSKVPEGHQPRGTTLRKALRGNVPEGFIEASRRSRRGFCRGLRGSAGGGGPRDFPSLVALCL